MHPLDHGFRAHFFAWRGRLNRMRHFKRQLAVFGLMCAAMLLLASVLDLLSPHLRHSEIVTWIIIALMGVVVLAYAVSSVMLQIRRLHDLNLSGFFLLLRLVPFVGISYLQRERRATTGSVTIRSDPPTYAISRKNHPPYAPPPAHPPHSKAKITIGTQRRENISPLIFFPAAAGSRGVILH